MGRGHGTRVNKPGNKKSDGKIDAMIGGHCVLGGVTV